MARGRQTARGGRYERNVEMWTAVAFLLILTTRTTSLAVYVSRRQQSSIFFLVGSGKKGGYLSLRAASRELPFVAAQHKSQKDVHPMVVGTSVKDTGASRVAYTRPHTRALFAFPPSRRKSGKANNFARRELISSARALIVGRCARSPKRTTTISACCPFLP